MTKLAKRHRLLGGALLLAAGAWAVDHFTSGGPKPAQATPAPTVGTATTVNPTGGPVNAGPTSWTDVQTLVSRLTDTQYTSVDTELAALDRDLFRPTPLIDAAFTGPELDAAAREAEANQPAQPPFEERHRLTGVMLGAKPLAIVDGQLLPLRSAFDEHVLVELRRDYVVFVRVADGARVRLDLETQQRARADAASDAPSPNVPAPPTLSP